MTTGDAAEFGKSALDAAIAAVLESATTSLAAWHRRADVARRRKPDGSMVTDADVSVETMLRSRLAGCLPGQIVCGEELGGDAGAGWTWWIDAIDGTRGFLSGDPRWRTMVGLELAGEPIVAVVSAPALGLIWWARKGGGAWTAALVNAQLGEPRHTRVTDAGDLADVRLGSVPEASEWSTSPQLRALRDACPRPLLPWQAHPALLVAEGRLDAALQRAGHRWDFVALELIVLESGGRCTRPDGAPLDAVVGPALWSNGRVHEGLIRVLGAAGTS